MRSSVRGHVLALALLLPTALALVPGRFWVRRGAPARGNVGALRSAVEEDAVVAPSFDKYRSVTIKNFEEFLTRLIDDESSSDTQKKDLAARLDDIRLASIIFPFKSSSYSMEELVDWKAEDLDSDPIYRLLFPTLDMLEEDHRQQLVAARDTQDPFELEKAVHEIRTALNPHPAGQISLNKPDEDDLTGIQHKYAETCLLFPAAGQTCHAYCTYCFRWAQFIQDDDLKFAQKDAGSFHRYLERHEEISDVLVTGGDPMIMRANVLAVYLGAFKDPNFLPHIRNIRIGTRTLTFWPQRFTTDSDAAAVLQLLHDIIEKGGRSLDIMAHLGHDVELSTSKFEAAVKALQGTGAVIRSQSPIMRGINADPDVWARKWRREVQLGIVPYYMFIARDTGAQKYFGVTLAEAHSIYSNAIRQVSGLARTARGPSMSCTPGKVEVTGIEVVQGQKVFVLRFLQCRDAAWIGRVFFAKFDAKAIWFDELEPMDGGSLLPWDEEGMIRAGTPEEVLSTLAPPKITPIIQIPSPDALPVAGGLPSEKYTYNNKTDIP